MIVNVVPILWRTGESNSASRPCVVEKAWDKRCRQLWANVGEKSAEGESGALCTIVPRIADELLDGLSTFIL
jgi:hypothetical protein